MFSAIHKWVRFDDSDLGRPKMAGSKEKVSTLAEPMCLLSLVHEMEDAGIVIAEDLDEIRKWCVTEICKHEQRNASRILENVSNEGQELKGTNGRLMNPGHAIECGWFLIKEADRAKDQALKQKAIDQFILNPIEYGADKEHGGIFYFLDADGNRVINQN